MEFFIRLEKAVFIGRPNRFLVRCRVGKRSVLAHMPNPGRMWELLLAMRMGALAPLLQGRGGKSG